MIYRHENRVCQLASVEVVSRRISPQGLLRTGVGYVYRSVRAVGLSAQGKNWAGHPYQPAFPKQLTVTVIIFPGGISTLLFSAFQVKTC